LETIPITIMRHAYVPDLVKVTAIQEANYQRLQWLLAKAHDQDVGHIITFVSRSGQDNSLPFSLNLQCLEIFPYTSTYKLCLQAIGMNSLILYVRCYHDLQMAEVVNTDAGFCQQYSGSYEYPNSKMFQPDEKYQLNRLLKEWLQQCESITGIKTVHNFSVQASN
jgi:uncharacterized protein YqiB (DUF1249 family)